MDPLPDPIQSPTVVPAALLAIAKDARYLHDAERLLREAWGSLVGGDRPASQLSEDSLLRWATPSVTLLLYIVLVVRRKQRTAGMEATGVSFENFSLWRTLLGVVGYGALHYVLHHDERTTANSPTTEQLTGESRRHVFDQQRDAMRRRAEQASSIYISPSQENEASRAPGEKAPSKQPWTHHLGILLKATLAQPPGFSGPHAVTTLDDRRTEWDTLLLWVIRFHLALFCWRGGFPTILHRFVYQTRMKQASPTETSQVNLRTTSLLLGAYSGSAVLSILACKVAKRLASRRSQQDQVAEPSAQPAPEITHDTYTDLIATRSICNICGQTRHKPACSIRCGHVFCWTCLQRWLATTAQACPICRKSCIPRDVILLRNYNGTQPGDD